MNLIEIKRKLTNLQSEYNFVCREVDKEKEKLEQCRQLVQDVLEAQGIIQDEAKKAQESAHKRISSIVTRCLQAVFKNEAYSFFVKFSKKRGKTEADLLFMKEGREYRPKSASGGGVVDVAAFALRLACLKLAKPALRRLMVLDEPFKMLSEGYRHRVKDMLEILAEELEVQFVIITHAKELLTGNVIELD